MKSNSVAQMKNFSEAATDLSGDAVVQMSDALGKLLADMFTGGKRVIHLALRWVLDQQAVSAALWGARQPDQLDPLDGVMGWKLGVAAMVEIDRIVREFVKDSVGPEFMAPPARHDLYGKETSQALGDHPHG